MNIQNLVVGFSIFSNKPDLLWYKLLTTFFHLQPGLAWNDETRISELSNVAVVVN